MAKFRPLRGALRVTSPFGERANPLDPDETGTHLGVDYSAAVGDSLFAIDDGVVTKVNNTNAGGNQLFVRLVDGETWAFSHLLDVGVGVGDRFKAGAIIALTGDTGRVTGPHVHIQRMNRSGVIVDADPLLQSLPQPGSTPKKKKSSGGAGVVVVVVGGLLLLFGASSRRRNNGNV